MKKLHLLFLMLFCVSGLFAQQSITRVEGSPYPKASAVPERLFLTSENYSYTQKITLQSMQGLLAQTKPEILRDVHGHAGVLEKHVTLDRTYYNNFNGLLAHFADRFDGYILCKARTASVNAAFSLSGILNAIVITEDLEGQAISAGYSFLLDVCNKDEAWVLANYGDRLNRSIASYQAVNDDRALFLGDYSVFSKALQFWDDKADGALATSVYQRMDPSAVYFGWGAGEYNTVEQLSKHSAMIHPSDWSPNLSTLSNIPTKLPRQKQQQTEYKVVEDVHTVCFVISDGDNIQWLSGSLGNTNNWANPDKARLKLGWTVSPAFAELAPTMYKRYVENAVTNGGARNLLIAGPSGVGYYFPSLYPKLAEQNEYMNRVLKKADISIVNIIDKDGYHNPNEYLKQSNVDALFYYSYGSQYQGVKGAIKWYKDKPSIGGRFTLWGNSSDGSAETRERVCQSLANTLNKQSTNIQSAQGYSLIPVHIWTMNPSDVLNCISKLNANVRVVSPDEFVWLVRKNVRKLNLASGNGLQAEYMLASAPNQVVLTTTEPTVDFDDEYLTEGTEAVGNNDFTVRWTGKVQAIYSEMYTFHSKASGGFLLKIDGQTLCNSLDATSVNASNTIQLQAGKQYDIEVQYKKTGEKGFCTLEWESASQLLQRIPRYQLSSRPMANTGLVTGYDGENFTGYSSALKFGDYDAAKLARVGFEAQTLKSLKVTEGFRVVLYSEDNFKGQSFTVDADNADIGEWTNKTVSVRVTNSGQNLPDGVYSIKPMNTDNVITLDGDYRNGKNGQITRLARNTGNINQQFRFTRQSDGTYRAETFLGNRSLEIANSSTEDGALLQQWSSHNEENQKFIVVPSADGATYNFYSYFSGKIITTATVSTTGLICQKGDVKPADARWRFELLPPPANGKGNGLTATYYNGQNFEKLVGTRIDPTINFDWGNGSPMAGVNNDSYSVRWEGKIEPRLTGEYMFYINSDNGRRLWIDNKLIIDKWIDDYDIEYSGGIRLEGDRVYDIKLEYFENFGGANCRLEWHGNKQPREIIPTSQLYSLDFDFTDIPLVETAGVMLYPNPASGDFVNITLQQLPAEGCLMTMYDITGKVVLTKRLTAANNQVDISNITQGVYIISLVDGNKRSVQKLIRR